MTWHRGPLSFMRNCKGSTSPGVAISAVQSEYVKRSCASLGLDRDLLGTLYQEAYEDQNVAKLVQCVPSADRNLEVKKAVGRPLEPELTPMPGLQSPKRQPVKL